MTLQPRKIDLGTASLSKEISDTVNIAVAAYLLGQAGASDAWFNHITDNGQDRQLIEELSALGAAIVAAKTSGDTQEIKLAVRALRQAVDTRLLKMQEKAASSQTVPEAVRRYQMAQDLARRRTEFRHWIGKIAVVAVPVLGTLGAVVAIPAGLNELNESVIQPELERRAAERAAAELAAQEEANRLQREQERLDQIITDALARRDTGFSAAYGMSLDGAMISFACVPTKITDSETGSDRYEWRAADVRDRWTSQGLEHPFFGIDFKAELGVEGSILEGGWGTTVIFTQEQRDAGLPETLGAERHDFGNNGSSRTLMTLPTGAFADDLSGIVPWVFTTGEIANDGYRVQYYVLNNGELECVGPAEKDDNPHMASGELKLFLSQQRLADFLPAGAELDVSPDYISSFEELAPGLGAWYAGYYRDLPAALEIAVRTASSEGVADEVLQPLVDYFYERQFEQALLSELTFLKREMNPDLFATVLARFAQQDKSNLFDLTNYKTVEGLNANGLQRGSLIDLHAKRLWGDVDSTITHELNHALLMDPHYGPGVSTMLKEGGTTWLQLVGHGKVTNRESSLDGISYSYGGRVRLFHALYQRGYLNDLMKIYALDPDVGLTEAQTHLIATEWGAPVTADASTQHLAAILFDAIGLEGVDSAPEVLEAGRQIYVEQLVPVQTKSNAVDGRDEVTQAADAIVAVLEQFSSAGDGVERTGDTGEEDEISEDLASGDGSTED